MRTDENRAILQQFGEAMERQDAAFMQAHPGLTDTTSFYQQLWAAFPDLRGAPQETISEGAWIAQRVLVSGTMRGAFMGLAPTGQQATWEVVHTCRIAEGQIVESHGQADVLGMMPHLGRAPVPGPAPS